MKRTLAIVLALVMVLALFACTPQTNQPAEQGNEPAAQGNENAPTGNENAPTGNENAPTGNENAPTGGEEATSELAGTYEIKVWVGEAAVELTEKQIEDFNNSNNMGIKFVATVNPVSEATSADQMLVDISAGADIYCFAQDQFARLVQGGALVALDETGAKIIREANDAGVVAAATSGETMYAYPLTSDNGYFMYYDKTVIPEEDVDSLEKLIADCEAADKYFAFEANTSAWYLASWFFATGCVSEWQTDDSGKFISVHDTFNSPEGLIAVKGMKKLVDSPKFLSSSKADEFSSGAAIVVTGTWEYENIKNLLGDHMGVTDLPSFEVDGKEYHLGSFNGCKLMGIKPQDDPYRQAALMYLAEFLTDEERQMERFNALSWGPSNLNAQKSEAVQANPGLAALLKQNEYSVPQGQIHGSWWDIAKVIADDVKAATDEAGLQAALDNYYNKINELFNLAGYIFVGAWGGWDNASMDYKMEEANGQLTITLDVPASDYMGGRIVLAGTWDNDLGYEQVKTGAEYLDASKAPSLGENNDNNIVFAEAGNYTVTVDLNTKEITIIKN
ncbi:MAG: extracellular solute-binding protein [Clostridia bacterium]|nr:extracellular solute-binding protein [Clostridia bacterium]